MKKLVCALLAMVLLISVLPLASASNGTQYFQKDYSSLIFGTDRKPDATHTTDGVTYNVYRVRYCVNPVAGLDEGYFMINIKVPVSYYGIEFTAEELANAPILMTNPWGGDIGAPAPAADGGLAGIYHYRLFSWLKQGWITVEPGMRGNEAEVGGIYYGKIPNPIIDLKAAIRYLRYGSNATNIPGDKEKIFFTGYSSGGTAAAMIGASGNANMFDEYLDEIGAAPGRDDVFAAIPGTPVIVRNYSSGAITWQLYYDDSKTLDENLAQFAYSDEKVNKMNAGLLKEFVEYLDGLKITASINGNQEMLNANNLDDYALQFIKAAADTAGDVLWDRTWRGFWDDKDDFSGMVSLFDDLLNVKRGEHAWMPDDIDTGGWMAESLGRSTDEYSYQSSFGLHWVQNNVTPPVEIEPELLEILELQYKAVDPLHFILGDGDVAPNWFIHQGTFDPVFPLAFLTTMNAALEMKGANTHMALEWGVSHEVTRSTDDDIIAWAKDILGIDGVGKWADGASSWAVSELGQALASGLVLEDMVGSWRQPTNRLLAAKAIVNLIEKSTGKTLDQIAAEKGFDMTEMFSDTDDKAVTFLKAAKISDGMGNNRYGPLETFTRAQMVTMFGRMAEQILGMDLNEYKLGTEVFSDLAGFGYANQYIGWAAETGITLGDGGADRFNPRGTLENQQTAAFSLRAFKAFPAVVYITFNGPTTSDITANGLAVSSQGDFLPPVMTQAGGQWALRAGVEDYIYFFINSEEVKKAQTVRMDITYFDNDEDWLNVEYCSSYPGEWNGINLYQHEYFEKTGTGEYRTAQVVLDRCNFTTGHNQGAQFRLSLGENIIVKSVTITVIE